MYYSLYKDIKNRIAEEFGVKIAPDTGIVIPQEGSAIMDIQWFNSQYDGVIHMAPVIFIEFSPLDISPATKQTNSTDINIRLHVVTEVMDESDGDVRDGDVLNHEELAEGVLNAVEGWRFDFNGHDTRPLQAVSWEHHHRYNGFMVTLVGLKTKG